MGLGIAVFSQDLKGDTASQYLFILILDILLVLIYANKGLNREYDIDLMWPPSLYEYEYMKNTKLFWVKKGLNSNL